MQLFCRFRAAASGKDLSGTKWNIINSLGQTLKTGILLKNNISIPVNDLNNGYYLFQLNASDRNIVQHPFLK